jgi:hypothetical protein
MSRHCACGNTFTVVEPDGARCGRGHWTPRGGDGLLSGDVAPTANGAGVSAGSPGTKPVRPVPVSPSDGRRRFVSAGTFKVEVPAETNSPTSAPFRTAREIAAETPATTRWIVTGLVAETSISELTGALKRSGKTTLLMALIAAVVDGQPFLGFPTERTGAVILTEQSTASLRVALDRAGLLDRDDVLVGLWHDLRSLPWSIVAQMATEAALERGFKVLAVDTLAQFAGLVGDTENSSGAALAAMAPLQEAAARGLAVIVSRHARKGGGEIGEDARGSSAFSGAVDIVLSLRRPEGQTRETIRMLQGLSRFSETPSELLIDLGEDGRYRALGTAHDVQKQDARRLVLAALPTNEGDAITTPELLDALAGAKIKRTVMLAVLAEYVESGEAGRLGAGKRGNPHRYFRPSGNLSAGDPYAPAERNGASLLCANCNVIIVEKSGEVCRYCHEEGA